jgi:hypothetical protein
LVTQKQVETVQDRFKKYCHQKKKLFIPDEARDPSIAKSLYKYHEEFSSLDVLDECIIKYIDDHEGTILIYDFAIVVGKIREQVEAERASVENFKKTLAETKARMESGY